MKEGIHPEFKTVTVQCACGAEYRDYFATTTCSIGILTHALPSTAPASIRLPGETFEGNVTTVFPTLDVHSRTIRVEATAHDLAGNASTMAEIWLQVADIVPPEVVSVEPADGAVVDASPTTIAMRFDEPMRITKVTLTDSTGKISTWFETTT